MTRLLSLLLLLAISITAHAEIEKELNYQSPDGHWSVVAHWVERNRGGYLWELRDLKTGKTYFKEDEDKIQANEAMAPRFSAGWSRDGRHVAINIYYGRITYDLLVIAVSGKEPREVELFPKDVKDYQGCSLSGHWKNNTDLEVEAFDNGSRRRYKDLLIRITADGGRIIQSGKWSE